MQHRQEASGALIKIAAVQCGNPHARTLDWEAVTVDTVFAVFKGIHILKRHIEGPWPEKMTFHPTAIYLHTYESVYDLKRSTFNEVERLFPSRTFWSAFKTLLVNVDKVQLLDRKGPRTARTGLVKRVGYHVYWDDPENLDRERKVWIALRRNVWGPFTKAVGARRLQI